MNLADQELEIELWTDLVVLAVVDSDLLDLQLAPLPSAAAAPAVGHAVVAELAAAAAAAVEPAAAAAAAVVVAELAGLAGLAAAPVVLLELVDVVVSFGLVPVHVERLEQLAAVPVENVVDEEAKGHHVMQDWLAASPQIVVGSWLGLAYHRSAIAVAVVLT